nr:hypothetical protein [uncultured Rhodopila sp.]
MSVQERLSASIAKRAFMASYRGQAAEPAGEPPIALVLGTGDIASAIGRELFALGWAVVLLRDHSVPVLRRGMAFDDALECGSAELDGVNALLSPSAEALPPLLRARRGVVVANLDPAVAASACGKVPDAIIDARMRKYAMPADIRPLAACTIGIGPGFVAGGNVHAAIETLPGQEGGVVTLGTTANPTGKAVPLGGAGAERFVYAPIAGPWQPQVPLGTWLDAGTIIGTLGEDSVLAPIGGCVRGMVRAAPGGVSRGSKLMEIDPRPEATWRGIPPRARRIAAGVECALATQTLDRIVAHA